MGGKSGGINKKQAQFVKEYLIDLNATQAAIRAGYSAKTADRIGPELLGKTCVAEAIRLEMEARSKRTEISQDRVLQEYAKLAFLDPRKFYDEQGNLIPVHQLPEDVAAALAGMDVATERVGRDEDGKPELATVRKIKLADKKGALDSVARHLGMFTDKVRNEVSGPDGSPLQILLSDPRWLSLQQEIIAAVCPACREKLIDILKWSK